MRCPSTAGTAKTVLMQSLTTYRLFSFLVLFRVLLVLAQASRLVLLPLARQPGLLLATQRELLLLSVIWRKEE